MSIKYMEPCSICLCSITSDLAVLLCGHKYHKQCIHQWWDTSKKMTCAYCRRGYDDAVDIYMEQPSDILLEINSDAVLQFQNDWNYNLEIAEWLLSLANLEIDSNIVLQFQNSCKRLDG